MSTAPILIVEDDPLVMDLLREILEGEGYAIAEAVEGRAAIEAARERSFAFRLVITDVVMRGMGGIALGEWMEDNMPETPVLYITGYGDIALDHFPSVLRKPFRKDELLAKIKKAVNPLEASSEQGSA